MPAPKTKPASTQPELLHLDAKLGPMVNLFTLVAALWCLFLLAAWVPQYLTWPWYNDNDHFAMLAQLWDTGRLPYRDFFSMQFPGEIYLYYLLGKLFGWGNTVAYYAFDAALVVAFGALLAAWSVKRFRTPLPGLIGFASFEYYYMAENFTVAGQRDWHAAFFAVAGLVLMEWRGGKWAKILGALSYAVGLSFRPQMVLLAPAFLLAIDADARARNATLAERARAIVAWFALIGAFLALAFLPLLYNGILGDFIRSIRYLQPGASGYSTLTGPIFLKRVYELFLQTRFNAIPILIFLTLWRVPRLTRASAFIALAAVLGVLFYGPISPNQYSNHAIAPMAALAFATAILAKIILDVAAEAPSAKLAALVLLLFLVAGKEPVFASLNGTFYSDKIVTHPDYVETSKQRHDYGSLGAIPILKSGAMPEQDPPGRRPSNIYAWRDYRAAILYLRSLDPSLTLENMIGDGDLAYNGVVPRLPALPADIFSIQAFSHTEPPCAKALESLDKTLVLWSPRAPHEKHPLIAEVVARLYEQQAKFGEIEVWRKKLTAKPH